jgi:hypothetical protein
VQHNRHEVTIGTFIGGNYVDDRFTKGFAQNPLRLVDYDYTLLL